MGIVSRTISGITSAPERPGFSSARCLNKRQHKIPCTLCHDLCPGNVFSMDPREPLHWDQCVNCGLCVSACPARCFTPGKQLQKQYTEGLNLSAPISFACYQESAPCTRRVECMAGIPWELIAALALYTHVVFYVGACSHCSHPQRVTCLRDNLMLVRDFLGPEKFTARVHVMKEGRFESPENNAAISRRALFSNLGQSIGKTVARTALDMVPFFDEDTDDNSLAYRELLIDTVDKVRESVRKAQEEAKAAAQAAASDPASAPAIPPMPTFGVHLPRFMKACYGCNICERICPHGALEVGEEKDGKRTIYISPGKCTGCNLCGNICPHGGISGTHLVQVPHLNRLPLVRVDSSTCSRCGVALKPGTPDNLCIPCARKTKKRF